MVLGGVREEGVRWASMVLGCVREEGSLHTCWSSGGDPLVPATGTLTTADYCFPRIVNKH